MSRCLKMFTAQKSQYGHCVFLGCSCICKHLYVYGKERVVQFPGSLHKHGFSSIRITNKSLYRKVSTSIVRTLYLKLHADFIMQVHIQYPDNQIDPLLLSIYHRVHREGTETTENISSVFSVPSLCSLCF